MIETDDVYRAQRLFDPVNPPGVALLFERFPIVDGIAPELPRGAEIIRGNARHNGRQAVLIQHEELRVRPHIHAIESHKDGNIANDFDTPLGSIALEFGPLAVEAILEIAVRMDGFRQAFAPLCKRLGLA